MKILDRYRQQAKLTDYEISGALALGVENTEKSLRVPMDNILRTRTHVLRESRPRRTLDRPVFIVGLPGSGSSFLHNLLGQIHGVRVPQVWEAQFQTPPRHANPVEDIRRIRSAREAVQQAISVRLATALVGGRSPTVAVSDSEITMPTFWSMNWGTVFRWQSYFDAWVKQDHTPTLEYHRRVVEEWAHFTPHERMVFRDPWHLFHMDALRAAYPDAQIVYLRRGVRECMRKLQGTVRLVQPDCGPVEDFECAWLMASEPDADITIDTAELSRWPLETVARVCDATGIALDRNSETRVMDWLETTHRPRSPACS